MKEISRNRCFGGMQYVFEHDAKETKCPMRFGLYLPPNSGGDKLPALIWLSGLTCTEQNFITKSGVQRYAAKEGIAIISPDTSPRNLGLPGENERDDFGSGASFYLDATLSPWANHYRMYSYISRELVDVVSENFALDRERVGLFGHSMGGHGALVIALRNPETFRSLSAFAPICSLTRSPWGEKVLKGYLGDREELWREYDGSLLIEKGCWKGRELLVDFGGSDPFLESQLKPHYLISASKAAALPLKINMHEGYDHSYYFVSTFIESHIHFHKKALS